MRIWTGLDWTGFHFCTTSTHPFWGGGESRVMFGEIKGEEGGEGERGEGERAGEGPVFGFIETLINRNAHHQSPPLFSFLVQSIHSVIHSSTPPVHTPHAPHAPPISHHPPHIHHPSTNQSPIPQFLNSPIPQSPIQSPILIPQSSDPPTSQSQSQSPNPQSPPQSQPSSFNPPPTIATSPFLTHNNDPSGLMTANCNQSILIQSRGRK